MSQYFGSLDWQENKRHFYLQLCSDVILDFEGTFWWEPFHFELWERLKCKNKLKELQHYICISDPIGTPLTWSNSTIRWIKLHVRKISTCTAAHRVHAFCWQSMKYHKSISPNLVQMFLNILMKQLSVLHHTKSSTIVYGRCNWNCYIYLPSYTDPLNNNKYMNDD